MNGGLRCFLHNISLLLIVSFSLSRSFLSVSLCSFLGSRAFLLSSRSWRFPLLPSLCLSPPGPAPLVIHLPFLFGPVAAAPSPCQRARRFDAKLLVRFPLCFLGATVAAWCPLSKPDCFSHGLFSRLQRTG